MNIAYQAGHKCFTAENCEVRIQSFGDNYFQAWNLSATTDSSENGGFIEQAMANPSVLAAKQYTTNDTVYGEITVIFFVYGTGFNMTVSRK